MGSAGEPGSVRAYAAVVDSGECGLNATYTLDSDGTLTISGSGKINDQVFEDNNNIKKVIINDGITSIGDSAFNWCENLEAASIPDSVTEIGVNTFNMTKLTHSQTTDLKYVDGWLVGCGYNEVSVVVPGDVRGIANGAFYYSLESVTLSEGITVIPDKAFYGCDDLKEVNIPTSVNKIGIHAFYNCTSLKTVTVPEGVSVINEKTFYGCTALEEVKLPSTVTKIEDYAFWNCTGLKKIDIPKGVIDIGNSVFYNCTSLADVNIPDTVRTIGDHAFASCGSLKSLTVPESVETIGDLAFGFSWNSSWEINLQKVPDFKLYCYRYSGAENYAVNNGIDYELLDSGFIKGDINFDTKVDTKDAMKAVAFDKKTAAPKNDDEFRAADVNGDEKLDSKDAMVIINAVKNKTAIK